MAYETKVLKGTALWAKVMPGQAEKWDNGTNKYVKADDGQYTIQVVLPEIEAQEMCEYLDGLGQEVFKAEVKRSPKLKASLSVQSPYEPEYDQDGNETGNIVFKFKANAMTKQGKKRNITVVDAKRKPVRDVEVGNGSTVKVAFTPMANHVAAQKKIFVTNYISAVQIIELQEYNGAADMFDDEDGFEADDVPTSTFSDEDDAPFDTDGDDDGVEGDF